MGMSKGEKRNAAKKIAETKSKAKKAMRDAKPKAVSDNKSVKGRKSLTNGKKK